MEYGSFLVNAPEIVSKFRSKWQAIPSKDKMDYLSTFLATGFMQFCGVATGILTARLLGPVGKGEVATVLWLPSFMVAAGIISLPQATAFYVSRHPEIGDKVTAVAFWASLIVGAVEALVLFPAIPAILGRKGIHLVGLSRAFLIYLPVAYCGLTLLGIDQGHQKFKRYNVLRLLPQALYALGLAPLFFFRTINVTTVVLINLLAQLVATLIRACLAGKKLIPEKHVSFFHQGKDLARQGIVFSLPALSGIVLMRADLAVLIHMVSAEHVGYYSVAMAIAMGQIGVSSSLVQVNFPKVSSVPKAQAEISLWRHFKRSIIPIMAMGTIIALSSRLIIKYLFGASFKPALPIAYVLTAAISVWGLGQVLENGLRGMGYGMPGAAANGIGLATLLGSSLLLVGRYKGVGMAVALLLAQVVAFITLLAWLRGLSNRNGSVRYSFFDK